jgi:hypothetical protein
VLQKLLVKARVTLFFQAELQLKKICAADCDRVQAGPGEMRSAARAAVLAETRKLASPNAAACNREQSSVFE